MPAHPEPAAEARAECGGRADYDLDDGGEAEVAIRAENDLLLPQERSEHGWRESSGTELGERM